MPKGVFTRKVKEGKYAQGTRHMCAGKEIVILERIPNPGKQPRAVIRFVDTGYVANVQLSNIPAGKVKDRRERTVYGVGYLDWDISIPTRSGALLRRVYDLWENMLRRCYFDHTGATVDPRWHSFRNFFNSLEQVPNFPAFEAGEDVHLDKDTRISGNKTYSVDTCVFLSAFENVQDSALRRWGRK